MANQQNNRLAGEEVSASKMELYIGDIDFPCGKEDLINYARDRRAPFEVLQLLEHFPKKQYASTVDIVHGFTYAQRHQRV